MAAAGAQRLVAFRAVLAAATMACGCAGVSAQVGASVTAFSDYRFRGVSLSDNRPGVQLGLNYDASGGAYMGTSLSQVALSRGHRYAQIAGYGGYAVTTSQGASWDSGAIAMHYTGDSSYDFVEVFSGLVAERWSARVHFAPDYFGRGVSTVYVDVNGSLPLGERVRLLGHAGLLATCGGNAVGDARKSRVDARLGVAVALGAADLQLAWVSASRGGPYPAVYDTRRSALLLSASLSY